ncbi:hypothetical protein [Streptomyces odonnellii]|nr:hypothetical protein [Streptomyces odonnellii]
MVLSLAFFAGSALLALFGLCAVALHDVPRITGTVAFILTAAAFIVALFH